MLLPTEHLNYFSKLFPSGWKLADEFRKSKGLDLPNWPDWCFLPIAGWYAIICKCKKIPKLDLESSANLGILAALGAWRYSQGIYKFDSSFYKAITDTIPGGDLPCHVLYRLPEWCVYIETPDMQWFGKTLYGFWCHLEWDANTERHELRLVLHMDKLISFPLHMGAWTVTEAVERTLDEARKNASYLHQIIYTDSAETIASSLHPIISLVLYLCSDEPEIDNSREPGQTPKRPQPVKVKGDWRLFPPSSPRIWEVGQLIGKELNKNNVAQYNETTTENKKSMISHLRRAHWHGYWKGSHGSEKNFHYHWLPPIIVKGGGNKKSEN